MVHFGNAEVTLCRDRSEVTTDITKVDCPQCRRILGWHLTNLDEASDCPHGCIPCSGDTCEEHPKYQASTH